MLSVLQPSLLNKRAVIAIDAGNAAGTAPFSLLNAGGGEQEESERANQKNRQ